MKSGWKLMISRRTTRCIATIYKKISFYFSIPLPFFFFFHKFHKFTLRICRSYMLVDPKIHFYKYPSQYFSSVFDIFLEARGSWLFSFGLLARGKSRFPFFRSKNVANAFFQIRYTIFPWKTFTRIVRSNVFEGERSRKYSRMRREKKVERTRKSFLLDRIVAAIKLHYARFSVLTPVRSFSTTRSR